MTAIPEAGATGGRRADRAWRLRSQAAAGAVVVGCDVLAHRLGSPAARTAARFTATAAVLGIARAAGVSWADLGLCRSELGSGIRVGAAAGACAACVVFAGATLPATRALFRDERAAEATGEGRFHAELARITLAAVPPEELTYRSALLGLGLRAAAPARAVAWSSALFGVSHISPTLSTMGRSALHGHVASRATRRAAFVAVNVVLTSVGGAAFAWLRLRSGSVLAPLIAHAALNDAALSAARVAHGLGGKGEKGRRAAQGRLPD